MWQPHQLARLSQQPTSHSLIRRERGSLASITLGSAAFNALAQQPYTSVAAHELPLKYLAYSLRVYLNSGVEAISSHALGQIAVNGHKLHLRAGVTHTHKQ